MNCTSHDHDCGESACAGSSLWRFVNHAGVRCFNAADGSYARAVLRPWEQRREREPVLESNEDDAELLLFVPFTSDVKARSHEGSTPASPPNNSRFTALWHCGLGRRWRLLSRVHARLLEQGRH